MESRSLHRIKIKHKELYISKSVMVTAKSFPTSPNQAGFGGKGTFNHKYKSHETQN